MVWLKIDDQIAHHPKFIEAGPIAAWLWICGNAYCNKYLTDGFIKTSALKMLSGVTNASKWAEQLASVGLWERVDGGYQVHDFHDFNPSAAEVKARRNTDRLRKESARNPHGQTTESARNPTGSRARVPTRPVPIRSEEEKEKEPASLSSASRDPFTDGKITERAGNFVRRYEELYPLHRFSARYAVHPVRDYAAAVTLCSTWKDDTRLEKLAICFLTTDHKFAAEGSRTLPQFLALASWCDGELAAWEKARA